MPGALQCDGSDNPDARSKRRKFSSVAESGRAVNTKQRVLRPALLYVILCSWGTDHNAFQRKANQFGRRYGMSLRLTPYRVTSRIYAPDLPSATFHEYF